MATTVAKLTEPCIPAVAICQARGCLTYFASLGGRKLTLRFCLSFDIMCVGSASCLGAWGREGGVRCGGLGLLGRTLVRCDLLVARLCVISDATDEVFLHLFILP